MCKCFICFRLDIICSSRRSPGLGLWFYEDNKTDKKVVFLFALLQADFMSVCLDFNLQWKLKKNIKLKFTD